MRHPGLFIGRFQPLHKGHLHALQEIFRNEEQLYIAIGSAQASFTKDNPFTTGERIMMLQSALEALNIPCHRYLIIPIPDVNNFQLWVDHVKRYVPPFGIVYTGSDVNRELFSKQKIPVKMLSLYQKEYHSGSEVRRRIKEDGDWESLVPPSIIELIKQFDGVRRVKSLNF